MQTSIRKCRVWIIEQTKELAKDLPDAERKKRAAAVTAKIMREFQMGTEEEIAQIEADLKDPTL